MFLDAGEVQSGPSRDGFLECQDLLDFLLYLTLKSSCIDAKAFGIKFTVNSTKWLSMRMKESWSCLLWCEVEGNAYEPALSQVVERRTRKEMNLTQTIIKVVSKATGDVIPPSKISLLALLRKMWRDRLNVLVLEATRGWICPRSDLASECWVSDKTSQLVR